MLKYFNYIGVRHGGSFLVFETFCTTARNNGMSGVNIGNFFKLTKIKRRGSHEKQSGGNGSDEGFG